MKLKSLLASAILLVIAGGSSFAQTKKAPATKTVKPANPKIKKLVGIGPFKIGQSTTAIVDSICKQTGRRLTVLNSRSELPRKRNYALEAAPGQDCDEVVAYASMVPDVKVFLFDKYELAGMHEIAELQLNFYKDTLYSATLYGWPTQILSDLIEKYDNGTRISEESVSKCKGVTIPLYKGGFIWKNENVTMEATLSVYADPETCEPQESKVIKVHDPMRSKKIEAEGDRLYNECVQAKRDAQLEKL
jgi:hypothetical protein